MELVGFSLEQSEVFSWLDPESKELFHFDIAPMRAYAEAGSPGVEKVCFQIEPEMAELFMKDRAVDVEHVKHTAMELIDRAMLPTFDASTERSLQPLIGVSMPDGTHLTVDGHHRLVMWTILNIPDGWMWMFEYETSKRFLLDVPESVNERLRAELSEGGTS